MHQSVKKLGINFEGTDPRQGERGIVKEREEDTGPALGVEASGAAQPAQDCTHATSFVQSRRRSDLEASRHDKDSLRDKCSARNARVGIRNFSRGQDTEESDISSHVIDRNDSQGSFGYKSNTFYSVSTRGQGIRCGL